MTKRSPFRYFMTSPEIIRLALMLFIWFPLSQRNVEDLLHERNIKISLETVRYWGNRFDLKRPKSESRRSAGRSWMSAAGRGCVKTPRCGMLPAIRECIYVRFH
jgi:hypothetical protein